jgi:predicted transcriptional regulator
MKGAAMEVHFSPDVQAQLDKLASESGREPSELIEDAMAGFFDQIAEIRQTLDSRYDDMKSGKVEGIPGDEVEAHFREKSAAARRSRQEAS